MSEYLITTREVPAQRVAARRDIVDNYASLGPNREIYRLGPNDTDDPATFVTEILFPVAPD